VAKAVAQNHLQDDGKNQYAIGPHDNMPDAPNEGVQSITELAGGLFLLFFSTHFDLPDETERMWIYRGRSVERPLYNYWIIKITTSTTDNHFLFFRLFAR
jgi:hypothetical protein